MVKNLAGLNCGLVLAECERVLGLHAKKHTHTHTGVDEKAVKEDKT